MNCTIISLSTILSHYLTLFTSFSFYLVRKEHREAWAFRPVVRLIMILVNIGLAGWLCFTHFRSDKHMWDFLYSEDIDKLEYRSGGRLRNVQQFLDKKRDVLNVFLLVVGTLIFLGKIIERTFDLFNYL